MSTTNTATTITFTDGQKKFAATWGTLNEVERLALELKVLFLLEDESDRLQLISLYRQGRQAADFRETLRLIREMQNMKESDGDLPAAGQLDRLAQFIEANLLAA